MFLYSAKTFSRPLHSTLDCIYFLLLNMGIFVIAFVRPLVWNAFLYYYYFNATSVGEIRFGLHCRQSQTYTVDLTFFDFTSMKLICIDLFLEMQHAAQYSLMILSRSSKPQIPVRHAMTRVNKQYSTVYCLTSIFLDIVF